jgi:hypothetical protein
MTSVIPMATAELLRMGRTSAPVGVVIKVGHPRDLDLAKRVTDELLVYARSRLVKATLGIDLDVRAAVFASLQPEFEAALRDWFEGVLASGGVRKDDLPIVEVVDWSVAADELGRVLATFYVDLGQTATAALSGELGLGELRFDLEGPATKPIRDMIADQVTRIIETTREELRTSIETAVGRGYSVEQIVAGVPDDGFAGLRDRFGIRARTIALTETANAYNAATLNGYRESGLVDAVTVFDGPDCGWTTHDDPDLAHGSQRSLDDAQKHLVSHPHCQRAFGPVVAR